MVSSYEIEAQKIQQTKRRCYRFVNKLKIPGNSAKTPNASGNLQYPV